MVSVKATSISRKISFYYFILKNILLFYFSISIKIILFKINPKNEERFL